MELRSLRYFLAAVREENITRAAQALHMTQPALSRQLMQLEAELGVPLFVRGKRQLRLTDAGLLLRQRAEELIALADKTQSEIQQQQGLASGTVALGCTESMAASALPGLLRAFSVSYPGIRFSLFCGNTDEVRERLDHGLADLGMAQEPVNSEKYAWVHLPYPGLWGALIPTDDPLAGNGEVPLAQLADKPLLFPGRQALHDEILSWFHDEGLSPHIVLTYNAAFSAVALAQNGFGYALCPQAVCSLADPARVRFCAFRPAHTTPGLLLWKRQQLFSPAAALFLDFARQYAEQAAHGCVSEA